MRLGAGAQSLRLQDGEELRQKRVLDVEAAGERQQAERLEAAAVRDVARILQEEPVARAPAAPRAAARASSCSGRARSRGERRRACRSRSAQCRGRPPRRRARSRRPGSRAACARPAPCATAAPLAAVRGDKRSGARRGFGGASGAPGELRCRSRSHRSRHRPRRRAPSTRKRIPTTSLSRAARSPSKRQVWTDPAGTAAVPTAGDSDVATREGLRIACQAHGAHRGPSLRDVPLVGSSQVQPRVTTRA